MTKHKAPQPCPYRAYQITQSNGQLVAYYDSGITNELPKDVLRDLNTLGWSVAEVKATAVAQWMGLPHTAARHLLGTSICYVHWQEGQAVKMPTGKVVKG